MESVIWGQRVPEITQGGGLVGLLHVFVQRVQLVNCFSGVSEHCYDSHKSKDRGLFDQKIHWNIDVILRNNYRDTEIPFKYL